jgi:sialate O-acetylesterase
MIPGITNADEWKKVKSLKGYWKFTIGDNADWSSPAYIDSDWEEIRVPSPWEEEGFHGYNGYAWYRKTIALPNYKGYRNLYLDLGYIDDVDQVFFNGYFIGGAGSFPPNYKTAYNARRRYLVPLEYFNDRGPNIIAVRIFDAELGGGITSGDIGFYTLKTIEVNVILEGLWKFKPGDDFNWKEKDFNDNSWEDIVVPSKWESAGHSDYNGFAWYRKEFSLPANFNKDELIFIAGKIDDIDQVYLNGQLIGSTGDMIRAPIDNLFDGEYAILRGYYIPENLLVKNGKNVVAVRVYDGFLDGGIYEGPVGLIKKDTYIDYLKRNARDSQSFWEKFFD